MYIIDQERIAGPQFTALRKNPLTIFGIGAIVIFCFPVICTILFLVMLWCKEDE